MPAVSSTSSHEIATVPLASTESHLNSGGSNGFVQPKAEGSEIFRNSAGRKKKKIYFNRLFIYYYTFNELLSFLQKYKIPAIVLSFISNPIKRIISSFSIKA
jgi:hypothetical protein